MATLNNIKDNVKCAATRTINKTGDIAEIAKLHLKLARLISKCDKEFEKLGKLTYRQLKSDNASYAEAIAAVLAHIDALTTQISRIKIKIEKLKAQNEAEKSNALQLHCECPSDVENGEEVAENVQEIINESIDELDD